MLLMLGMGLLPGKSTRAQQSTAVTISFIPTFANREIAAEEQYASPSGQDSFLIEVLRFYISGIRLYEGDKVVFTERDGYHLVDIATPESRRVRINLPEGTRFDHLRFYLGVDSATNTAGAMGGDLDPVNGMYWTWQSGYINFKLEGKSRRCPARNNRFEFHLGGYRAPACALQEISFPVQQASGVNIYLPVDRFLQQTDIGTQYAVMIPGAAAVALSRRLADLFYTILP